LDKHPTDLFSEAGMAEIILFGASGGIGQCLVRHLASEHRIEGTYCHADVAKLAPGANYHRLDVNDPDAAAQLIERLAADLTRPVLIYTPGISPNAVAHKVTDADWERTITTNLTGAMRAMRAVLPVMRARNWGRIVLLSSVLARQGVPGTLAYSATKAALAALARVVAAENAAKGVTANTLALGYFSVGIIEAVPPKYLNEQVLPRIPQGRLGDPADIVAAIRFIIAADYLTGATLDINGGMIGL
jgi:acetoacetyl-CoA reductase